MADHSKLKIAELKDELDKRGVAYGKSDKKQTLVNLLDGAVATPTIATAGFEPALTLSSTNDEATSVPTATSNESATSDENPLTASDAFASNNSNDVPVPLIASTAAPTATEFKSNGPSDEAHSTAAAADVPASTLTATSSRSFEDRTDTIVDEVPSGIEHSADGEDEQRGGNDVLGTDEEEIKLGALSPPTSSADAAADAKMEASAPETAVAEEHKDEAASMNDADASIPVAAAPTPAPSSVPTPPPPTPTGKRSLSPAAHDPDAKIATTSEAPPAKRTKHDEPTYPEPANFVAGSHPPTKALYITGLRRPLPDAVLIDLLEGFGELDFQAGIGKGAGNPNSETEKEGWWLSPVKSHAFAAYTTPEAARKAYESLLGRTDFPPEAPQPTPALIVEFLPTVEIPRLIAQEEAAWSDGRKKLDLKIAPSGQGEQTWSFTYSTAGNVDLRGNARPRALISGGSSASTFSSFNGGSRGAFAPRGGFQTGGSRGGFGGAVEGGGRSGFGGRGGFMDRGLAPHLTGGYSNARKGPDRSDVTASNSSFSAGRPSAASSSSSTTWGDRGRPAPFRADREDELDRWGPYSTAGRGRDPRDDGWGGSSRGRGGGNSFRSHDTYRPDNRRDTGGSYNRPDDRASGSGGGWEARGRDSRRPPSPPPRWKRSPSPIRRRSRSPNGERNDSW